MEFKTLHQNHRAFFQTHQTKSIAFRKQALRRLLNTLKKEEQQVYTALEKDLKKPEYESYLSEYFVVVKEIQLMLQHLNAWAKPKRITSSPLNFPSKDYLLAEPYGCTLHISPWNYPFQLALNSVIGAIAAGNTVVLKPSEMAPHTAALLEKIVAASFPQEHAAVVQGGAETAQSLLELRWDYIFYTGSTRIGKIIATAAAQHLTPTTLELGGKSPCVVDGTTPLELTAKRIVWGKFINCGQTCIAPDYVLVHEKYGEALLEQLIAQLKKAFGTNPEQSESYARIVNATHFERLTAWMQDSEIRYGGQTDKKDLYIAPTLLFDPKAKGKAMEEEIFGPLLPVVTYQTKDEAETIMGKFEKPLAFYMFSKDKDWINSLAYRFSNGGMVVNDAVVQFINNKLPFGGVGHSGQGSYHGKYSFNTFSHFKPIVKRGLWNDPFVRYAPYPKKYDWLKKFLSWV